MFCKEEGRDTTATLNCNIKYISEIVSFLSVVFSIVVIIIARKIKMNVINKLIIQILISEILDGLNILLVILDDALGPKIFDNYNSKTYICFSQIFVSVFSCFWTLTASFFISLRIYDIMVKKNKIFKNKIMEKYVLFFSVAFPMIISYIFWLIQVILQTYKLDNLSKEKYYQKKHEHDHFRHMYCWLSKGINIAMFLFVLVLIGANVFLSIFKGSAFVNKISIELKEAQEKYEAYGLQKKIDDVEHIKKTLWIYPITSCILWFSFFILQFLFYALTKNGFLSWIYCLLISIRQSIYAIIFLYTQKDLQNQFIKTFLCKKKKIMRKTIGIINDIQKGGKLEPDNDKIL